VAEWVLEGYYTITAINRYDVPEFPTVSLHIFSDLAFVGKTYTF
jgi:hypothetical protein